MFLCEGACHVGVTNMEDLDPRGPLQYMLPSHQARPPTLQLVSTLLLPSLSR